VIVDESNDGRSASVSRPFLLVPGSHAPHKNIDALLGALRRLGQVRLPQFVFIGPFAPSALDGRLPRERGVSLGYVTPEQRDELVAACDGIVVPSVFEGFGMPYAEALLKGKPVIASDIPPARELLGDEALYFAPPYGEAEILQTLQAAAQGGLRRPSIAAVSRMRALTDPNNVARTLIAMLRDIAHSHQS
jgi:glycosyltransferase involved in cell wall biosynthesis